MPVPLTYRLRPAELDDLPHCLEIDSSYITTHVWQLAEQFVEEDDLGESNNPSPRHRPRIMGKPEKRGVNSFQVGFNLSRLPRPLAVPSPWSEEQLLAEWKRTDLLLVAEAYDDSPTDSPEGFALEARREIIGYTGVTVDGPRHIAWITSGGVQIDYRRRGIGQAMLNEARRWADRYRLRSLMVELQTKNYPAIDFVQQNGFYFCGYNNSYYASREIALFFALRLEKPL